MFSYFLFQQVSPFSKCLTLGSTRKAHHTKGRPGISQKYQTSLKNLPGISTLA